MAQFTLGISENLSIRDDSRIGVVVSRWNGHVTERLLEGAMQRFSALGLASSQVDVFWCPGAYEIPVTAKLALETGKYHGILALGAVIRGETPHFEYVAGAASDGVMRVMLDTGRPIVFGVLTVENDDQALERARVDRGDKGGEAALTLLEMLALEDQIKN